MGQQLKVFCCYAHEDHQYLVMLKNHLKPYQHAGLITVQADIDVTPGEEREQKITHFLDTAQIILLLVSSDFIASDYCYSKEMKRAMERHKAGEARVIPVILRPVDWKGTPFGGLQPLPTKVQPITSWSNLDEAFLDVAKGIWDAIEKLMIQSQPRKIALFGYETQGGNSSVLWSDPGTFSLNGKYLEWSETKRDFSEREIVDHVWIKAGDSGNFSTFHFLPKGLLYESPLLDSTERLLGSWKLINEILRTNIEQYEGGRLVKYELDIFANRNDLFHSGIESNNIQTAHNYFVLLPSQQAAKRLEEALTAYNQLLSVNQNCAEAYKAKGNILRDLGRYKEALDAYQRAIELKPNYMWAWYDKGDILRKLKQYEEAVAAFDHAIELDGKNAWAWYEKAQTFYDLERYKEALAAYDQATQVDPNNAWFWHHKGETFRELRQYQEALASYERALELKSQHASIWTRKGQVLRMLKRYEEAIMAYDQALQLETNYVDAYLGKGRVYLDLKDYNRALHVYEQATNVAPSNTWTWHDKGQTLGLLQRAEEALEAFERAIELDPENTWAWFHKAETLTYLAQQAYKKAGQPGREPLKRHYYNLIQKASGKCLDGDGRRVYLHDPNGGDFQLWKATEVSRDIIVLRHFRSGKVLEATKERGIYFNKYTANLAQQWKLEDVDEGYKKLRHLATGMVLYGDTQDNIYLQPDVEEEFQAWKAVKIHIALFTAPYDALDTAEILTFEQ